MTRRIRERSDLAGFFLVWWRVGELWFLLGVFEKSCGWRGVFCGQSVVNCVVKMVLCRTFITARKMGQGFRLYFAPWDGEGMFGRIGAIYGAGGGADAS
jgi:hypothetical protein